MSQDTERETSPAGCPSQVTLADFVAGKLAHEEIERVGEHVASCANCQSQLESLDQPADMLVAQLRQADAGDGEEEDCAEVVERVEAIGAPPSSDFTPTREADLGDLHPPRVQLREYELVGLLGEGGMGAVHKAVHTKLKRTVAVKLLPKLKSSNASAVARFLREMEAVGKLNHPNIVAATDAGEVDGQHFLVMEYVEGIDVAAVVHKHGPLKIADACEIVRQAAVGLQHAHDHGLVHRDIKPSNLMLSKDGTVKVLDLGLARLQSDKDLSEDLTGPGQIMGTFDFMAPEQGKSSRSVDIRADLYSLGCTLYQLLVGKPPFADRKYDTMAKKILAHAQEPVPSIQKRRKDVPDGVAEVLERLLAKMPQDRYSDPKSLIERLRPFCNGADLKALVTGEPTPASEQAAISTVDAVQDASTEAPTAPHTPHISATQPLSSVHGASNRGILVGAALLLALAFLTIIIIITKRPGDPPTSIHVWNISTVINNVETNMNITVQQTGDRITGMIQTEGGEPTPIRNAVFNEGKLKFDADPVVNGKPVPIRVAADVTEQGLKGDVTYTPPDGEAHTAPIVAKPAGTTVPASTNKESVANSDEAIEKSSDTLTAKDLAPTVTPAPIGVEVDPDYTLLATIDYDYESSHLACDVIINGKSAGTFVKAGETPVAKLLKPGWNEITVRCKSRELPESSENMKLALGRAVKDDEGKTQLRPTIWQFETSDDWKLKEGRYVHKSAPNVTEAECTFHVYIGDLKYDLTQPKAGDYLLGSDLTYDGYNLNATATVTINGVPLPSFYSGSDRRLVVTPLLRKGLNRVLVESRAAENVLKSVKVKLSVIGPARMHPRSGDLEYEPRLQFFGNGAWINDQETLQPVVPWDREAKTVVREYFLYLRHDPQSPPPKPPEGTMAVSFARVYPSYDNGLLCSAYVNDAKVGEFFSEACEPVSRLKDKDWNEVRIVTEAKFKANSGGLYLTVGPLAHGKSGALTIPHGLWRFTPDLYWKLVNYKWRHHSGPDATKTERTGRFYFDSADLDLMNPVLGEGDYVLKMSSAYSHMPPVVTTLRINDRLLTSFFTSNRSMRITPFLKKGVNTFSFTSERVKGALAYDYTTVAVYGPANWIVSKGEHVATEKVLSYSSGDGWKKSDDLQIVNATDPTSNTVTQTKTLVIERLPMKGDARQ